MNFLFGENGEWRFSFNTEDDRTYMFLVNEKDLDSEKLQGFFRPDKLNNNLRIFAYGELGPKDAKYRRLNGGMI